MTPQQQELLQHEEFIAEVERIRAGPGHKRGKWLEILNSSALTTVITVVVGGVFGNLIVSRYQDRQKQSAVAQEQYQIFLQKQRDVVDHAVELIGDGQFDSAGLLALTQPRFNVRNAQGKIPTDIQKKREEILSAHDSYVSKWGTGSFKTAVLLDYYFLGGGTVAEAWRSVAANLDDLENCAEKQYEDSQQHGFTNTPVNKLCPDEQGKLKQALEQFSHSLDEARNYAWQRFSIATSTQ